MNQYLKLILLALAIGFGFSIADLLNGRQFQSASFFDCLLASFLILWCDRVDDEKKAKTRGEP